MEEAEIIRRAQEGDEDARDELFRRHYANLHAWVRLKQSDAGRRFESSADVVQSVFRVVLADLSRFEYRGANSFRNWLFQYALFRLRDRDRFCRAQRRDIGRQEAEPLSNLYGTICTASQVVDARQRVQQFEAAFAQLSPNDREIILLARIHGMPHAEVAERIGVSVAAARQALSRALVRLAARMSAPPG
jgi:RNA polymerase sigma-70 factor (ECF subfamily)